ncbi:MAG TPA: addiction module protein [Vicinamibacteria bacterium]|nr:addiction module protein [Vicinamibacteria bacterium]
MTKRVEIPPPGFDNLSVDEQIEYVQDLWDWIAARPEDIPVADWQKDVAELRLREYRANPNAVVPWAEVRTRLLEKYSTKGR